MKQLLILGTFLLVFSLAACSKKSDPGPVIHTIKFTATGTAAFTAMVSAVKTTSAISSMLDNRAVAAGTAYDFTATLNSGDAVHFEIQTMGANTVNYTITDNGAIAVQQSNKEVSSFSKVTADYIVN